jgi:hypothetical protein
MKKISLKNKIALGLALSMTMASLSSCLKNGKYYTDFGSIQASVDLPLAAANVNGIVEFDYDSTTVTASIPVYVNVASVSTLNKAVPATLAIDSVYLAQYNADNSTNYKLLPAAAYKVSNYNLNIPANQRLDSALVTFDFTKVNIADTANLYVLPFTISSSSLPIEQWNHLLLHPVVPPPDSN